jgi:hypothetical protein
MRVADHPRDRLVFSFCPLLRQIRALRWFRMRERATGKEGGTLFFQAEGYGLEVGNSRVLSNPTLSLRFGEQGVWDSRLTNDGIASPCLVNRLISAPTKSAPYPPS